MIQPSLSLVDREVEFCVPTYDLIVLRLLVTIFVSIFCFIFFVRKNLGSRDCTEIRTQVPTSEGFEVTN